MSLVTLRKARGTLRAWGRPVVTMLGIQLLSGAVVLPRLSFFPIYLEERLGYTPLAVSFFRQLAFRRVRPDRFPTEAPRP